MSDFLKSTFSLAGKTAVVTGGGRGIGEMMTNSLVRAGAKVYICSRNIAACQHLADEINADDAIVGECLAIAADLSNNDGIAAFAAELSARESALHILINNSGCTWGAPLDEFAEAAWDKVMDLNVKTPFFLTQKLLPLLEQGAGERDPARVINVASVAGFDPDPIGAFSYGPSKAALLHLTRNLSHDLMKRNINVNAIAPGLFPSKMTSFMMADEQTCEFAASGVPMGRFGEADEIGALAIFLCCKASAFMTGNAIPLDGGHLVGKAG